MRRETKNTIFGITCASDEHNLLDLCIIFIFYTTKCPSISQYFGLKLYLLHSRKRNFGQGQLYFRRIMNQPQTLFVKLSPCFKKGPRLRPQDSMFVEVMKYQPITPSIIVRNLTHLMEHGLNGLNLMSRESTMWLGRLKMAYFWLVEGVQVAKVQHSLIGVGQSLNQALTSLLTLASKYLCLGNIF